MPKFLVKCPVCAWVSETGVEACPVCGAVLPTMGKPSTELPASFAEKYRDQVPPDSVPTHAAQPSTERSWTGAAVVLGALLIIVAALAGVFLMVNESPRVTPPVVYGPTPAPTPAPTPPASVAALVEQLNDPGFSVHMVVATVYQADARISPTGKSIATRAQLEAQISNGDEQGLFTAHGTSIEFRLVKGTYYQKTGNNWTAKVVLPAHTAQTPLFDLRDPKVLTLAGEEVLDGMNVVHLKTTKSWSADYPRIALLDRFYVNPQTVWLDLWATPEGTPVRAIFHVTTDAFDGTHLQTVEARYDFTDPGVPVEILPPPPK